MYKFITAIAFLFYGAQCFAQFHPPAGSLGTSAIHKDSSIFVGWASQCSIQRGLVDVSTPSLGYASVGDSLMAIGEAGLNGVVSLGDGGIATLTFETTIYDGPGWDFAVFENSFDGLFLELAFVEVSSDGVNYIRFNATSNTQDSVQIDGFGQIDATKINNLAGKYKSLFGTPFDLSDLPFSSNLDVTKISHIRIVDVVGSIDNSYSTFDQNGAKVNDPWPTPFTSSGFDLDAVGAININSLSTNQYSIVSKMAVYPNPISNNTKLYFYLQKSASIRIVVHDVYGKELIAFSNRFQAGNNAFDFNGQILPMGVYFISLVNNDFSEVIKIIKNE